MFFNIFIVYLVDVVKTVLAWKLWILFEFILELVYEIAGDDLRVVLGWVGFLFEDGFADAFVDG